MSTCPNCGAVLNADFGMVTCASCNSVLFVDMDGLAHFSEPPAASPGSLEAARSPLPTLEEEYASPDFDPPPADAPIASPLPPDLDFVPVSMEPEPENYVEQSLAAPIDAEFTPSPEDPLGLNGYANSELSQAKDGPLLFKLSVSGIDSKEMRESIREALGDPRFGWDAAEVMSRIKLGRLTIDALSPVKATVLVNRLKRMPVRIEWEQHAITQLEAPPDASSAESGV